MKHTVLIADDHELIRAGLRALLQGSTFEVVAEASDGEEVCEKVAAIQPDIVLLDVRMPRGDGMHVLSRLRVEHANVLVILISVYDNPVYISRAATLGAAGYLLKSVSRDKLLAVLQSAVSGGEVWTRDELRRVTSAMAAPRMEIDLDVPLTQRECEVLRLLAIGKSNQEIADSMSISYETVKEHVQNILRKIGVANRTQAALWAVRKHIV